ncbi:hypothetical protein ACFRMQ_09395 [Kitasatospora sp. NPDC056783]|uniref:hypothetical protein n=1 Tax=Kitasatospora sp. NPDC056783 TaxID=3345943 RepID=UPI0036A890CE
MTDTPATLLSAALPDAAARAPYPAVLREGGRVRTSEPHRRYAEGVNSTAPANGSTGPAACEQIARPPARGLTRRAIASRPGLGERMVAAHISRLREWYEAETLFQLVRRMRGAHDV